MGACLRNLNREQQNRALRSLNVISVFNKFNHYLHDMQLLVQNQSQDDSRNGIVYLIDPGALAPKKRVNQVFGDSIFEKAGRSFVFRNFFWYFFLNI